jgi:hypothetical protein
MRFMCWLLGHNNTEQYSDGDYFNGESPTFHCKRCGERENFLEDNALVRFYREMKYIFTGNF